MSKKSGIVVDAYYIDYNIGIDLERLKGIERVLNASDKVKITDICSHIAKASSYGISLAPFIDDREFRFSRLKDITDCVSSIGKRNLLGKAIKDIITEGSISKDRLRLLEGDADKLKSFLLQYFDVRRQSFNDIETLNIIVKGINTNEPLPIPLIKHIAALKFEWVKDVMLEFDNEEIKEEAHIGATTKEELRIRSDNRFWSVKGRERPETYS